MELTGVVQSSWMVVLGYSKTEQCTFALLLHQLKRKMVFVGSPQISVANTRMLVRHGVSFERGGFIMKRWFLPVLIFALVFAMGAGHAMAELIIYYDYEAVQDGMVMDMSGNGINGQINGIVDVVEPVVPAHGMAGKFEQGSYLDLDGPSIPNDLIPKDAFSITAWVNVEDTGGHHAIFNARAADEQWLTHPEVRPSSGIYRWLLRSDASIGGTLFDIQTGTPTVGEWAHFAGTYSKADGVGILYIDGVEIGREDARIADAPVAGDWDMGARVGLNIDDARPFTGLMDDFTIWNVALTPDQIVDIMDNGPITPGAVSSKSKLATSWGTLKAF